MMFTNIPSWWMWIILVGLLAAMIAWDLLGRPARHRVLRMTAIVLAVASLTLLYMKPFWVQESDAMRVAIVTNNADQDVLDSLANRQVVLLNSFDAYLLRSEEVTIDELLVVGDGLEAWELERLGRPFVYLPSKKIAEGPFDYWPAKATERAALELTIAVQLSDSLTIQLSGSGIDTQSRKVTKNQSKVTFEVVPNLAGNVLFQLDGLRGNDTVFSEVLPMQVKPALPKTVLVLTSAPSFELRNLKNHLTASGFAVAERQKVSKESYHQSFVNMKERNLSRLSISLLKDFQLVVVDGAGYEALSGSDRRNLLDRLETGELGLVWMGAKGTHSPIALQKGSTSKLTFTGEEDQVTLEIQPWKAVNGEELLYQGQGIGQTKSHGLGKVVVPSLSNSYTLLLKGEKQLYGDIWKELLQPVIGKEWENADVEVPAFAQVNEPMRIVTNDERILADSVKLAVEEQWFLENNWEASYWPAERGWNSISIVDKTSDLFVFGSDDWPIQKSRRMQRLTASYAGELANIEGHSVTTSVPISPWYFFGLFVLAFGYLWVEQRVGF